MGQRGVQLQARGGGSVIYINYIVSHIINGRCEVDVYKRQELNNTTQAIITGGDPQKEFEKLQEYAEDAWGE